MTKLTGGRILALMNTNRKTSIVVGSLYILGTVSGILSLVFSGPVREAQEILAAAAAHPTQLVTGALFVLVMGLALAMIPVVLFPFMRKLNEPLALAYVVLRGGLEAVTYLATAAGWLFLLPLSRVSPRAEGPAAADLQALAGVLLENEQISAILAVVFCLGALVFYVLLYRYRLVPRWLSGWGLVAVPLYLAAGLLTMFAVTGPLSGLGVALNLPMALQEMVLAVWLIVKGFKTGG